MGSVRVDIYKQDREWNIVNLSTPESVKGLLKLRSHYDLLYDRRFYRDVEQTDIDISKMTGEIICLYAWLDSIIKRMKFSKQHKRILELYIRGRSESDIAKICNMSQRNVNRILNTISKNISREAELDWLRIALMKRGLKTKKCKVCNRELPIVDEFFSPDEKAVDGYRKICKTCRNLS